ncbi:hypothetical protein AB1Y20_009407 [Prymnesium parvum]|uniref:Cyclic nucleotide-binding domain-containing protein n=1 Tax=Prymnesium parvum TaxID=97485 RepID=A0AB34K488_PRYPA
MSLALAASQSLDNAHPDDPGMPHFLPGPSPDGAAPPATRLRAPQPAELPVSPQPSENSPPAASPRADAAPAAATRRPADEGASSDVVPPPAAEEKACVASRRRKRRVSLCAAAERTAAPALEGAEASDSPAPGVSPSSRGRCSSAASGSQSELMALLGVEPPGGNSLLSSSPFTQVRVTSQLLRRGIHTAVQRQSKSGRFNASQVAVQWAVSQTSAGEDRREVFRRILKKSPEQRTDVELVYLQEWARRVRFSDAEQLAHIKMDLLCRVMKMATIAEDQLVCMQGDEGDNFYIVFSGSCLCYVVIEGKKRHAMPTDRPVTEQERLDDEAIRESMRQALLQFHEAETLARLKEEAAARLSRGGKPPAEEPSAGQESCAAEAVASAHAKEAPHADGSEDPSSSASTARRKLPPKATHTRSTSSVGPPAASGKQKYVFKMVREQVENDCFGEMALLFAAPRAASVVCNDDCELVCISRNDYNQVLKGSMQATFQLRARFLSTLPIFDQVHLSTLNKIASVMAKVVYQPGDDVLKLESEHMVMKGDMILIVEDGSLALQEAGSSSHPTRCLLILGKGTVWGASDEPIGLRRGKIQLVAQTECSILRCKREGLIHQAGRNCVADMAAQEMAMRRASLLDVPAATLKSQLEWASHKPTPSISSVASKTTLATLHSRVPKFVQPSLSPSCSLDDRAMRRSPSQTTFTRAAAAVQRTRGGRRDILQLLEQRQERVERQLQHRHIFGLGLLSTQ